MVAPEHGFAGYPANNLSSNKRYRILDTKKDALDIQPIVLIYVRSDLRQNTLDIQADTGYKEQDAPDIRSDTGYQKQDAPDIWADTGYKKG